MNPLDQVREFLSANADEPVIVLRGIEYSQLLDAKFELDSLRALNLHYVKQIMFIDKQLKNLKRLHARVDN